MSQRERPILFSGPMVRAVLEGRKSQTRRVIRGGPNHVHCGRLLGDWALSRGLVRMEGAVATFDLQIAVDDSAKCDFRCPYGEPGDRLWVRETWCPVDDRENGGKLWVDYRATPRYSSEHPAGWDAAPGDPEALRWRPSIHMPRWASRITLEIVAVRVERLGDITEEDARAEGVADRQEFARIWRTLHAGHPERDWHATPWVWVLSFKRVQEGQTP